MLKQKQHSGKDAFYLLVYKMLSDMGLKILESKVDYVTEKPDMVAIYVDKKKYYVVEVISEECLSIDSDRLNMTGALEKYRQFYKQLFKKSPTQAAILASIVCDLVNAVESFTFKSVRGYQLNSMTMYVTVAIPNKYLKDVEKVLDYLKIEHGSLDVLGKFTLVLISKEDSAKLMETRRFIQFMLNNN